MTFPAGVHESTYALCGLVYPISRFPINPFPPVVCSYLLLLLLFVVLRLEHTLGKHSTIELHAQPTGSNLNEKFIIVESSIMEAGLVRQRPV